MLKRAAFYCLFFLCTFIGTAQQLHNVPVQQLDLNVLLGDLSGKGTTAISAFSISDFITCADYKSYLLAVKEDSTETFYISQLPDPKIADSARYQRYLADPVFESLPVVGISWDNAQNYCRWKTVRENPGDSIAFIYRLPTLSEWLAAYHFFETTGAKHDFHQTYSDWLLNSYDESLDDYYKGSAVPHDHFYTHEPGDVPAMKRKLVVGDSYLFQRERLEDYFGIPYYYATRGYRQIGFRIVKVQPSESPGKQLRRYTLDSPNVNKHL